MLLVVEGPLTVTEVGVEMMSVALAADAMVRAAAPNRKASLLMTASLDGGHDSANVC
jgi:hypothetical protein